MPERRYRGSREEGISAKAALITAALAVFALISVFVLLNDTFLHIEGIPTTKQILVALGLGGEPPVELVEGEISVCFIDVGQGDCELIITPKCTVLIDCGERENAETVAGFITDMGIERLDYVIATHPHSDHIGAMADLLERFSVGRLIMPYIPDDMLPSTSCYLRMMEQVDKNGILCSYANVGEQIYLGAGTYLEILAPIGEDYEGLNDFSVVTRLVHGENSFLFTGDIERTAESNILAGGADISADVLKAAHHGSSTSNTKDFLNAVSPKYAVICAGSDNSYGHPHMETVARLKKMDCEMLMTMELGNIIFISDGESLRIYGGGEELVGGEAA